MTDWSEDHEVRDHGGKKEEYMDLQSEEHEEKSCEEVQSEEVLLQVDQHRIHASVKEKDKKGSWESSEQKRGQKKAQKSVCSSSFCFLSFGCDSSCLLCYLLYYFFVVFATAFLQLDKNPAESPFV